METESDRKQGGGSEEEGVSRREGRRERSKRGQKGSARQGPTPASSPHTPTRWCAEPHKDVAT